MVKSCESIFLINALLEAGSRFLLPVACLGILFLFIAAFYRRTRAVALVSLFTLSIFLLFIGLQVPGLAFIAVALYALAYPMVIYGLGLTFPRIIQVLCSLPIVTHLFFIISAYSDWVVDMETKDACFSALNEKGHHE